MVDKNNEKPFIEGEMARKWVEVSELVLRARAGLDPTSVNDELEKYAAEDATGRLAPLYLLWAADSCVQECRYKAAILFYEKSQSNLQDKNSTFSGVDLRRAVLQGKATAFELDKKLGEAISTYQQLANEAPHRWMAAEAHYMAAIVAQEQGNHKEAIEAFRTVAKLAEGDRAAVELLDQAKRDLRQYEDRGRCFLNATELHHRLANALQKGNLGTLRNLASQTHFRVGLAAAHAEFVNAEAELNQLGHDLARSRVRLSNPDRSGSGSKIYLHTQGWRGQFYRGRVSFLLVDTPFGWQWQGIILLTPTRQWIKRWQPQRVETNQPVGMELKAPWPARMWFMAGGLKPFLAHLGAIGVLASIWFVGTVLAALFVEALSLRRCGFGTRGFYYNFGPTHSGDDAFSIDFSRYLRGLPFVNTSARASGNAVQMGVVDAMVTRFRTGSARGANLVQIHHVRGRSREGRFDPAPGTTVLGPIMFFFEPYWSRYLHFAGPGPIVVSAGMFVRQGALLGRIDDTGENSVINHLHFTLYDDRLTSISGRRPGRSIRPSPMEGATLGDDDDGKCIRSTNVPFP